MKAITITPVDDLHDAIVLDGESVEFTLYPPSHKGRSAWVATVADMLQRIPCVFVYSDDDLAMHANQSLFR